MSANRIVQRRAYKAAVPSAGRWAQMERDAARRGLPKLSDRITFQQWKKAVSK